MSECKRGRKKERSDETEGEQWSQTYHESTERPSQYEAAVLQVCEWRMTELQKSAELPY